MKTTVIAITCLLTGCGIMLANLGQTQEEIEARTGAAFALSQRPQQEYFYDLSKYCVAVTYWPDASGRRVSVRERYYKRNRKPLTRDEIGNLLYITAFGHAPWKNPNGLEAGDGSITWSSIDDKAMAKYFPRSGALIIAVVLKDS